MKKKIAISIFTVIFLTAAATTETCITGYACKINPESTAEENRKSNGLFPKIIDNILKNEKQNLNNFEIKKNIEKNTDKNIKIEKQN